MKASRPWGTASLVLIVIVSAAGSAAAAAAQDAPIASGAQSGSSSLFIEPEIVRITYIEGDVRLASADGKNAIGKNWVQAQAGAPIEQGDTIATGTGRAEIELEDESMIYLADNSTLLFEVTSVLQDAPLTKVELVSGTATLDVHPVPNGHFELDSPSDDHISLTSPEAAFVRVESYVDALVVTPQKDTDTTHDEGNKVQLRAGQTVIYQQPTVYITDPSKIQPPNEWDQWVSSQAALRQTDMQAALKASGLTDPLPGLIDLYKTGTFSPCEPYGTCWQPGVASAAPPSQDSTPSSGAQQAQPQTPATPLPPSNQSSAGRNPKQLTRPFSYQLEPCVTVEGYEIWDPKQQKWVKLTQQTTSTYWNWASCRAGTWINQGHGFVLVLHKEKKRHHHHHPPVCWVRVNGKTGFVPRDPRDKKGQPPLNLKYGLFVPGGKPGDPTKLVQVDSSKGVKILDDPPRNFAEISSNLAPAQQPAIESRMLGAADANAMLPARASAPGIPYDYKKNGFASPGSKGKQMVAIVNFRDVSVKNRTLWTGIKIPSGSNVSGAELVQAITTGRVQPVSRGRTNSGTSPGIARGSSNGGRGKGAVGRSSGGSNRSAGGGHSGGGRSSGSSNRGGGGGGRSSGGGGSRGGGGGGGGGSRGGGGGGGSRGGGGGGGGSSGARPK
ncbi:MAG TPA: FecR family protein [Candidatus Acidoferrales bacterium]|jgi:hypothetical protein|nr:FecR family protein [Candidatus Acidoferrales bacterium]